MSDELKPVDLEAEKRRLVEKIHALLNKFHEKTGYAVAGLETEYEREVNVIHYRTELILFNKVNTSDLPYMSANYYKDGDWRTGIKA